MYLPRDCTKSPVRSGGLRWQSALNFIIAAMFASWSGPLFANEWVTGTVENVGDYSAYSAPLGVLVRLTNQTWTAGSTGPTACSAGFRIVGGYLNVTEQMKDRMYAAALSAAMSGRKVGLYVDSSGSPGYCFVQIVNTGTTVP